MTLLEETNSLLTSRLAEGVSLAEIANSSDGTVDREWLYKFAREKISHPSVIRIQALHDHLKSQVAAA